MEAHELTSGTNIEPHRLGAAACILVAMGLAMVATSGCTAWSRARSDAAHADFAAHPGYRGIVVDRMLGGQTADMVRAQAAPSTGGPTHTLRADGKVVAALWISEPDRVTVRQAPEATAPLVGKVQASRQPGAIRLMFRLADGASFHTSRFDRIDADAFPNALENDIFPIDDLPGLYRAALRDAQNADVGWLRVRVLPYQGLPREYDADVPAPLNGSLAAAAVALLDAEINSIVQRNALPEDRMPEGLAP